MAIAFSILAILIGILGIIIGNIAKSKADEAIVKSSRSDRRLDSLSEAVDKIKPFEARNCRTHGHEIESVFEEIPNNNTMDVSLINTLSTAAQDNNESLEDLIKAVSGSRREYVHSVCRRCGTVIQKDGKKVTQPAEDLDEG